MPEPSLFKNTLLSGDGFCVTWEQVPGRGTGGRRNLILANTARAARGGLVKAISITDNPGGNPAYAAGMLCAEINKLGIESLVHLAMCDKNRNEIESLLYALDGAGVRNLLVVSGDYPAPGIFGGSARPVFDLDPIHVLQLIQRLNAGLEYNSRHRTIKLPPTDFFAGVGVSPFKQLEAELMGQYFKLDKKIGAGAQFVVSQVGYDARKAQELLLRLRRGGHTVPALANIYVISYSAARLMNANKVPGCVVSEKLLGVLEREQQTADKGREAGLVRAAKMYAVARGLGYRGAHIGGHGLTYDDVKYIAGRGEELAPRWQELVAEFDYSQPDGFYLFRQDKESGLNTEEPVSSVTKGRKSAVYSFSRLAHNILFDPARPLPGVYRRLARWADRTRMVKRLLVFLEHFNKRVLFDCRDCGDCALAETGYLCPVSQCPKGMRAGSCGGSFEGWCEVYPGARRCVWVRAFERLKAHGRLDTLRRPPPPPRDWSLDHTSAWLNFYMGRDHMSKHTNPEPLPRSSKE